MTAPLNSIETQHVYGLLRAFLFAPFQLLYSVRSSSARQMLYEMRTFGRHFDFGHLQ
jgi:hypothetical protein